MHHYGARNHNDLLTFRTSLLKQRGSLPDRGFKLPLRRDPIAHECEREAVAFLRLRQDSNAPHSHHHTIAFTKIPEPAASRMTERNHDHGVHALILDLNPFASMTYLRAVIRGRVKVLRRAAIALHRC